MTKFYIEYNPYLEKCIFKMNGKDLCGKKSNSKFKAKVDTRLQILLGESINWKDCITITGRPGSGVGW